MNTTHDPQKNNQHSWGGNRLRTPAQFGQPSQSDQPGQPGGPGHPGQPEQMLPPTPPKVGRPDGLAPSLKEAPENVRWAVVAWLITAALQIAHALVQFASTAMDSRTLYAQMKKQLEQNTGGLSVEQLSEMFGLTPEQSISRMVFLSNITMTAWMVCAALVCAWLTLRAGRGGNYSRMFLSVGSIYLGLNALLMVFSSAPDSMNILLALLLGILTILSGVTAVLGLYFITRPDNAQWLGIPPESEVEAYRKEMLKFQERQDKAKKQAKEQAKQAKEAKRGQQTPVMTNGGQHQAQPPAQHTAGGQHQAQPPAQHTAGNQPEHNVEHNNAEHNNNAR